MEENSSTHPLLEGQPRIWRIVVDIGVGQKRNPDLEETRKGVSAALPRTS